MILNLSFISEPAVLLQALETIKGEILPALRGSDNVAALKMMHVAEVGGSPVGKEDPQSFAIQLEFDSEEKLRDFQANTLPGHLQRYSAKFGEHSVVFATLLREIGI